MASNNVTTDWKTVLATAKAKLNPLVIQINRLEAAVDPLRANVNTIKSAVAATKLQLDTAIAQNRPNPAYIQILPLKEAAEADPNNAAKQKAWRDAQAKFSAQEAQLKQATAQLEVVYNNQLVSLGNAQKELAAALDQIKPLYAQEEQYQAQVDEAERQLRLQTSGTAPGTSNRLAATTTPASSNPGNPNVATASVVTQKAAESNTAVSTTAVASGSKTAVPSPTTAEARPASSPAKVVKPTKTVTTTRTVVVSDGVPEALKTAPVGAQWYKVGSKDGKIPAMNLRKTKDGFVFFASGQAAYKATPAEAATFFRSKGLTNCNMPQYMPKKVTKKITEKKTVPDTKGAPKKTEDKPKEEIPPPFDASDILLAQTVQSSFDQADFSGIAEDWRVRLSLAPNANYLYAGDNPGILQPLKATNGVVFPYMPQVVVNYQANYNPIDLVHTNYKVFQYTNSSVDQVTITCEFTAQDVYEARYLLAVIHFFKTMTKMFYGQDTYPVRGTPPPLCYIFGLGGYQFSAHPLGITSFNYNLPNDVDYIRTTAPVSRTESNIEGNIEDALNTLYTDLNISTSQSQDRLGEGLKPGGLLPPAKFNYAPKDITTWVPTKIQLSIGCIPIMSRNQVSNYFSLNDYASGYLVKGQTRPGGGMW